MRLGRGHYTAVAAGVLWGTAALFIRNLLNIGFTPFQIAAYRLLATALVLGVIIFLRGRDGFKIKKKDIPYIALFGIIGMGVGYITNTSAIKYTTLATAIILSYTHPIYTTVLAAVFFKEKIYRSKVIGLVMLILGCLFLVKAYDMVYFKLNLYGILFGLSTGVCISTASLCAKKLSGDYHPFTTLFYTFVFGGLFLLVFVIPGGAPVIQYTFDTIVSIVLLIGVSTVAAYSLYLYSVSRIEVSQAGMCATVEPVTATVLGFLFFGEVLEGVQMVGALVMIAGIITYNNAWSTFLVKRAGMPEGGTANYDRIEGCSESGNSQRK